MGKNNYLPVIFLLGFVAIGLGYNLGLKDELNEKMRCRCELKVKMMKCRTNATDDDLCFQCATACGKQVTTAYFHKGSSCMADKLKSSCCQNVTAVLIDDPSLCECYCKVKGVSISGSDPKRPIDCKCPGSEVENEQGHFVKRSGFVCDTTTFAFFAFMVMMLMLIFSIAFRRNQVRTTVHHFTADNAKLLEGKSNPTFVN